MGKRSRTKKLNRQERSSQKPNPDILNQFIPSKIMDRPLCGGYSVHLIFAPKGATPADPEFLAENRIESIKRIDLPTWILGQQEGTPRADKPIHLLKVWPKRSKVETRLPNDFNPMLHELRVDCTQHRHVDESILQDNAEVLPASTPEQLEAMSKAFEIKKLRDEIHAEK